MKCFNYEDYLNFLQMKDKIDLRKFLLDECIDTFCGVNDTSEKYIVDNPNDKIFRTILGSKKQVVETINKVVMIEKKIKEEDIEKYNSSYINEKFENRESDVVYKMKKQNIFLLIEHQTKVDYDMPRRIFSYELEIMKEALGYKRKMKSTDKLPIIISIIIYTGRQRWNVAKYIQDCQEKLEGTKGLKFGEYYVVDINGYTDEEFIKKVTKINDKNLKRIKKEIDIDK